MTVPDFDDWRREARSFEQVAAYTLSSMNNVTLLGRGEPEIVHATMAGSNLFRTLGIQPLEGRAFSDAEEQAKEQVALMLIACANLAHLFLARIIERRMEISIRKASGAQPRRLVRQIIGEGLLLAAVGGAAGIALTASTNRLYREFAANHIARAKWTGFEGPVKKWAVAGDFALEMIVRGPQRQYSNEQKCSFHGNYASLDCTYDGRLPYNR